MNLVSLDSILTFHRGITFKPDDKVDAGTDGSVVCLRTKNIQKELDERDLLAVPSSFVKRDELYVKKGDILISSANSWELVGKCVRINKTRYKSTIGGFISMLRPKADVIDPDYLFRFLSMDKTQDSIRHLGKQTTNISNLDRVRFLQLKIPLPPLETQKQIAAVLEKADQLRKDCKQMEQELNSLAQSVFIEMFGDPVTNPKGWETTYLPNHGTFKNGLNFAKADSGAKLRYLGVGDFKSLSTISNMNSLGWIDLNESPSKDYLLQCGDLVFVRSNGNKALVGRCISVYPKSESVTYSGFCIRYRVEDNKIEPEYLNYLLRTKSMKKALLEGGQGANIQNINQKILSSLAIPLPPNEKQQVFCKAIKSYRESTLRLSEHSIELESLFQSLMQKAFNGELNLDNAKT
jgi:type I restriction enzyme S subunit